MYRYDWAVKLGRRRPERAPWASHSLCGQAQAPKVPACPCRRMWRAEKANVQKGLDVGPRGAEYLGLEIWDKKTGDLIVSSSPRGQLMPAENSESWRVGAESQGPRPLPELTDTTSCGPICHPGRKREKAALEKSLDRPEYTIRDHLVCSRKSRIDYPSYSAEWPWRIWLGRSHPCFIQNNHL